MSIEFSKVKEDLLRMYGGANGSKIGIEYQGKPYMLKFPPLITRNSEINYDNSCISEYIGCHIFQSIGIYSQKTILGKYNGKTVVACEDFEQEGYILAEFAQIKNTILDIGSNGYSTEISDILFVIRNQRVCDKIQLEKYFWEMFIVDAFLGNFDRHNGNWGVLINKQTGMVKHAPIYDCGSCLYPRVMDVQKQYILSNKEEIHKRIYTFPTSALKNNDIKINYFTYLTQTNEPQCKKALIDIRNNIDMKKIQNIVDKTPYISDIYKEFILTMLLARKKLIIDEAAIKETTYDENSILDTTPHM